MTDVCGLTVTIFMVSNFTENYDFLPKIAITSGNNKNVVVFGLDFARNMTEISRTRRGFTMNCVLKFIVE